METLWDMFTTVIFVAVPTVVGVGVLVLITGWGIGLYQKMSIAQAETAKAHNEARYDLALKELDLQRQGVSIDLIRPDANGLLPLPRAALDAYPRQLITLMSQHIDAHKALPVMPQNLHYAPHITQAKGEAKALEVNELPQLMTPEPPKEKADLWKLYHADQLPTDGFLLGHNLEDGTPVIVGWKQLYSALVGGVSGSGKSTAIRALIAQAVMQRAKLVVCDPHYGAGEESLAASLKPLEPMMLIPPAGSDEAIKDALKFINATIDRRLKDDGADREPVILVIDELTGIFNRGTVAAEVEYTLRLVTTESRKTAVYALGIGQVFTSTTLPTDIRNCFASFISCRTRRDMARCMSGSNEFGKAAEGLTIGQAVYQSPQGELVTVAVPNTTQHHLELVAKSLGNGNFDATPITPTSKALPNHFQSPSTDIKPEGVEATTGSDMEGDGQSSDNPVTLKMDAGRIALIKTLIKAGKTKPEILREVWNVDSRVGGRKYQTASNDYDQVIMTIVKGL